MRLENGKYSVSDGPFTESKEVVGGFAILDAPSKEVAIGYVKEFLERGWERACANCGSSTTRIACRRVAHRSRAYVRAAG